MLDEWGNGDGTPARQRLAIRFIIAASATNNSVMSVTCAVAISVTCCIVPVNSLHVSSNTFQKDIVAHEATKGHNPREVDHNCSLGMERSTRSKTSSTTPLAMQPLWRGGQTHGRGTYCNHGQHQLENVDVTVEIVEHHKQSNSQHLCSGEKGDFRQGSKNGWREQQVLVCFVHVVGVALIAATHEG